MKFFTRAAAALFVAAVPVFLVTANIRLLAGDIGFYERGFREHDSERRTGIPLAQLDRAGQEIIDYFEDDSDALHILVTVDGDEVSLFSEKETAHMEDVKSLMRFVFRLNEVSLAVILCYLGAAVLWTGERTLAGLAKLTLLGVGAGMALVAMVGALALTGFDAAWEQFHEVAFQNDLWQLDPDTDRLIQMFPEPFWEEATFIAVGLTLAEVVTLVAVCLAYLVFWRPKRLPTASSSGPVAETVRSA